MDDCDNGVGLKATSERQEKLQCWMKDALPPTPNTPAEAAVDQHSPKAELTRQLESELKLEREALDTARKEAARDARRASSQVPRNAKEEAQRTMEPTAQREAEEAT